MGTEQVRFYSHGASLAGTLKLPDARQRRRTGGRRRPGPGLARPARREAVPARTTRRCSAAGIAVLVFDYRGFGDSEGDATYLDPHGPGRGLPQRGHLPRDPPGDRPRPARRVRLGRHRRRQRDHGRRPRRAVQGDGQPGARSPTAATGCTGCAASTSGWSSWSAPPSTACERRPRPATASWSPPRDGIMVPTPERKTTTIKADVDQRVPAQVALASAEAIFAYRPIDVVDRIAPRALMFICVENDATTPEDHAYALYERAGGPKRLVVQTGTTHYARLRPVPGHRQPAHRRVVPSATSWPARCIVHEAHGRGVGHLPDRPRRDAPPEARHVSRCDLVIRGGTVVTPRRHAPRRTSPSTASASPRSSSRARRSTADADHRRHRQARPARAPSTSTRTIASRASPTRRTSSRRRRACAAGGVTTSFAMPNVSPPPNTVEHLDAMLELYRAEGASSTGTSTPPGTVPEEIAGLADAWASPRSRCSWSWTPAAPTRTCRASASTTTASCWRSSRRSRETGVPLMVHPHDQALMTHIEEGFWDRGERDCRRPTPRRTPPTTGSSGTPPRRCCCASRRRPARRSTCSTPRPRASSSSSARPRPPARHVSAELNPWAAVPGQRLGEHRATRLVRPVLLGPGEATPSRSGRRSATAPSTSSRPTTRPHTREEKEPGWTDGWKAHTGTPSAQFYVPLFLDAARPRPASAWSASSSSSRPPRPAIFGLADKGRLEVGADADIAIVDLDREFEIRDEDVLSKIGWTPYAGPAGAGRDRHAPSSAAASSTTTAPSSASPGGAARRRPTR